MSISNEEREYLQSLVDSMGEVRIAYKMSDDAEEKKQLKIQYENLSGLHTAFFNKILEYDIPFTQADVDAVKKIGERISQAASHQQLIIAIAELAAKYAI